jgi:hypothetical protein
MKAVRIILPTLILSAFSLTNSFASAGHAEVDTSLTYNSGILVLAFAGFLALVVVVQTIPAIVSLYTMISKAAETKRQRLAVRADAHN